MGVIIDTFHKYYIDDQTTEVIGDFEPGDIYLLMELDELAQKKEAKISGFDFAEIDYLVANYIIQAVEEQKFSYDKNGEKIIFECLLEEYMKITFTDKSDVELDFTKNIEFERGSKYAS